MMADFLVIGGGIMGLSIARALKRRRPKSSVCLLEKERDCGLHASSRNSGVLHAGFYYSPDSLKARLTKEGNAALKAYCESRGIDVLRCGKLVLASGPEDEPLIAELLRRAEANGVRLQPIDEEQARRIEPRAIVRGRALFSPDTACVDPLAVMRAMREDAVREGVTLRLGALFMGRAPRGVRTSMGDIEAGYVVNAAGLYADRVARLFGFSQAYRMLPFKGLYLGLDESAASQRPLDAALPRDSARSASALRTHIYPLPDPAYPFLGVHLTILHGGKVKIGPSAIPALWREQYRGLENFRFLEFLEISSQVLGLLLRSGSDFRTLAWEELRRLSASRLLSLASRLVGDLPPVDRWSWEPAGIRAQLMDIRSGSLVMDFLLEGDDVSMHVLNAVSPGFTCALPFAEYVCDRIEQIADRSAGLPHAKKL